MRYQFIQEHQGQFRSTILFRMLGVCASAFYQWQKRPVSQRAQQKQHLMAHIGELFEQSQGTLWQSSHPPRLAGSGHPVQPEACGPTDEGTQSGGAQSLAGSWQPPILVMLFPLPKTC